MTTSVNSDAVYTKVCPDKNAKKGDGLNNNVYLMYI